jgi:hypothetical protein
VIEEVPLCPSLVAVMVALPAATAVTKPFVPTVAAAVLLELHVTARPVSTLPFASFVTAVNCCVEVIPRTRLTVAGLTVTVATGTAFTVMEGVVALGALSLVAVIVAIPTPAAVTVTVAPLAVLTELAALSERIAGLLETQFTVRPDNALPLPSFGVAVSTCVLPTTIGVAGADSVTVATGIGLTVIAGVGFELIDSLVAVIIAVPTPTAVTVTGEPFGLTVSTAVLLEVQVMVRPVSRLPLASLVVAVSCCVPPTIIGVVGAETATVATGAGVMVRAALPTCPSLVAAMLAVPTLTAETRPVADDTVATPVFSELHATVRLASTRPLASSRVAVACVVCIALIELAASDTVTVATGACVMVIVALPLFPSLVAVMLAVPTATAVTTPWASTVATVVLPELQVIVRPVRTRP